MQGVRFLCMCLLGVLARVRGEFPARSVGDAGMVPLSLRVPAKGGTQMPQTRCAQTVPFLKATQNSID